VRHRHGAAFGVRGAHGLVERHQHVGELRVRGGLGAQAARPRHQQARERRSGLEPTAVWEVGAGPGHQPLGER
jgi:hypothetical protein